MPRSLMRRSSQKYKGQSHKVAMQLFGLPEGKLMESREERQHMIDVLSLSANPFMKELVRCARSPEQARTSFAKLMEKNAIPGENVMKEYAAIQRTRGIQGMAFHLPEIMQQTALAARVHDEVCPRCRGKKQVVLKNMQMEDCPKCHGDGVVRVDADPESLKLVFNTFGLTATNGSTNVNVNVPVTVNPGQSMEDLSRDVASIIEGTVKVSQ